MGEPWSHGLHIQYHIQYLSLRAGSKKVAMEELHAGTSLGGYSLSPSSSAVTVTGRFGLFSTK